jgi:2'-5' RNA ligase
MITEKRGDNSIELDDEDEAILDAIWAKRMKPVELSGNTGAMIAIYPPREVAERLALATDGAEKPEDLHVTLAYFGEAANTNPGKWEEVERALEGWCRQQTSFRAWVGGVGKFFVDEGDGNAAHVLLIDAPALPVFRQSLIDYLHSLDLMENQEHGYTAHMTLTYADPDYQLPKPKETEWVIDTISLVVADRRVDYVLRSNRVENFNPNHDDKTGKFSSKDGGGGASEPVKLKAGQWVSREGKVVEVVFSNDDVTKYREYFKNGKVKTEYLVSTKYQTPDRVQIVEGPTVKLKPVLPPKPVETPKPVEKPAEAPKPVEKPKETPKPAEKPDEAPKPVASTEASRTMGRRVVGGSAEQRALVRSALDYLGDDCGKFLDTIRDVQITSRVDPKEYTYAEYAKGSVILYKAAFDSKNSKYRDATVVMAGHLIHEFYHSKQGPRMAWTFKEYDAIASTSSWAKRRLKTETDPVRRASLEEIVYEGNAYAKRIQSGKVRR